MPESTQKVLIAVILILHGIGHYMGILTAFGAKLSGKTSPHSWLLTGLLGESRTKFILIAIMAVSLFAFIAAGMSLAGWLLPYSLFETAALTGAVVSLAGLLLYRDTYALLFNKIGAFAVNIGVIYWLLKE